MLEKIIKLNLKKNGIIDLEKLKDITFDQKNLRYYFIILNNRVIIHLSNFDEKTNTSEIIATAGIAGDFDTIIIADLPYEAHYDIYFYKPDELNLIVKAKIFDNYTIKLDGWHGSTTISPESKNNVHLALHKYTHPQFPQSNVNSSHHFTYLSYKGYLYIHNADFPFQNFTLKANTAFLQIQLKAYGYESFVYTAANCQFCSLSPCIKTPPSNKKHDGNKIDKSTVFEAGYEYLFIDSHMNDAIYWKKGNHRFSLDKIKNHSLPPLPRKIENIIVRTKKDFDAIKPYHDQDKNLTLASTSSLSIWKRLTNSTDKKWELASFKFYGDQ